MATHVCRMRASAIESGPSYAYTRTWIYKHTRIYGPPQGYMAHTHTHLLCRQEYIILEAAFERLLSVDSIWNPKNNVSAFSCNARTKNRISVTAAKHKTHRTTTHTSRGTTALPPKTSQLTWQPNIYSTHTHIHARDDHCGPSEEMLNKHSENPNRARSLSLCYTIFAIHAISTINATTSHNNSILNYIQNVCVCICYIYYIIKMLRTRHAHSVDCRCGKGLRRPVREHTHVEYIVHICERHRCSINAGHLYISYIFGPPTAVRGWKFNLISRRACVSK